MNIGKMIYTLRKKKNVTQEELAAELGVTAAAVSKWEKGYTLPDILMLCALADYFQVTTDELLGRTLKRHSAVVLASTLALGDKIKSAAMEHRMDILAVYDSKEEATSHLRNDPSITHLLVGLIGNQFPDLNFDLGGRSVSLYLSISDTESGILSDVCNYLNNNT